MTKLAQRMLGQRGWLTIVGRTKSSLMLVNFKQNTFFFFKLNEYCFFSTSLKRTLSVMVPFAHSVAFRLDEILTCWRYVSFFQVTYDYTPASSAILKKIKIKTKLKRMKNGAYYSFCFTTCVNTFQCRVVHIHLYKCFFVSRLNYYLLFSVIKMCSHRAQEYSCVNLHSPNVQLLNKWMKIHNANEPPESSEEFESYLICVLRCIFFKYSLDKRNNGINAVHIHTLHQMNKCAANSTVRQINVELFWMWSHVSHTLKRFAL